MRHIRLASCLAVFAIAAITACAAQSFAKDEPKKEAPKKDPAAEMAEWMKLAEPGPEHKKIASMAGEWDCATTMFMPDGSKMESKGKESAKVVLGGRFVESTHEGTMMGMPFTGKGMFGYDNIKKMYVMSWTDTMGTGITMFEGKCDESGKVLTMTAEQKGPDGKVEKMKAVTTHIDDNTHTFDMYGVQPDGKEVKVMSIKYTRVK